MPDRVLLGSSFRFLKHFYAYNFAYYCICLQYIYKHGIPSHKMAKLLLILGVTTNKIYFGFEYCNNLLNIFLNILRTCSIKMTFSEKASDIRAGSKIALFLHLFLFPALFVCFYHLNIQLTGNQIV